MATKEELRDELIKIITKEHVRANGVPNPGEASRQADAIVVLANCIMDAERNEYI